LTKRKYHHGDLKLALIEAGISLLNREGNEAFSLRKVAKECGVSQTAPYRHFKDKDELIYAMIMHIMQQFNLSLEQAIRKHPDNPKAQMSEMGVAYIRFFVENPEYLRIIFLNKKPDEYQGMGSCPGYEIPEGHPFATFFSALERYSEQMEGSGVDKDQLMLYSWGLVHGIAILIVNNEIPYPKNYMQVAEKLLWNQIFLR
jgi:AcrR family transcriptional regulator